MRPLTVTEPFAHEDAPIKGSRFLALVRPVHDVDGANALMRALEAEHPSWDHCCWAWRLRSGPTRTWDAGEPRGSAGRPILAQIEGHGFYDVAVVVLRHFGGTKLGVGGLIRAYGGAAGMALDRAPRVELIDQADLVFDYAYEDTQPVEAVLAAARATTRHTEWGARVQRRVRVDADQAEALIDALGERTAGRVVATITAGS